MKTNSQHQRQPPPPPPYNGIAAPLLTSLTKCIYYMTDGTMYFLGPPLICIAVTIIVVLAYSIHAVLLPMVFPGGYFTLHAILHQLFVGFVIVNIFFNYFFCVTTKNFGPGSHFDSVVRELAIATGFYFPETLEEEEEWRLQWRKVMTSRYHRAFAMRRRQIQQQQQQQQQRRRHPIGVKYNIPEHVTDTLGNGGNTTTLDGDLSPSATNASTVKSEYTNHASHSLDKRESSSVIANDSYQNNTHSTSTTIDKISSRNKKSNISHIGGNKSIVKLRSWMLYGPNEWSYCERSKLPKPPRSHFDHVTRTLVLNLDHYCPWMFNAVGYFNYRYFCNFLFYVSIGLLYSGCLSYGPYNLVESTEYNHQLLKHHSATIIGKYHEQQQLQNNGTNMTIDLNLSREPSHLERNLVMFTFLISISIGLAVGTMFCFHLYIALTGQTTIEFHGNWAKRKEAKHHGDVFINPYDLGLQQNFQQIWGCGPLWKVFLPSWKSREFLPLPSAGMVGKRSLNTNRDCSLRKSLRNRVDESRAEINTNECNNRKRSNAKMASHGVADIV